MFRKPDGHKIRAVIFVAVGAFLLWVSDSKATVFSWDCAFSKRIDQLGQHKDNFRFYIMLDSANGKGWIKGNLGMAEVQVHVGGAALSFIKRLPTGAVQTTTIMADGLAVHSRRTLFGSEFLAAQYRGRCLRN